MANHVIKLENNKFVPESTHVHGLDTVEFQNQLGVSVTLTLPDCFQSFGDHEIGDEGSYTGHIVEDPTSGSHALKGTTPTPPGVLETPEVDPGEVIVVADF